MVCLEGTPEVKGLVGDEEKEEKQQEGKGPEAGTEHAEHRNPSEWGKQSHAPTVPREDKDTEK